MFACGAYRATIFRMCSHYEAPADPSRVQTHFGVQLPLGLKHDLWPGYFGPFIRKHEHADVGDEAVPFRELMPGSFGMVPHWCKDPTYARRTYNARSETVSEKPSFQAAWRLGRHCVIPAEAFYEPDWRSGKAVPTRITRADGKPMGIAGLWTGTEMPGGHILRSYTMLTINADDHELMRLYHKPKDEKRMVVVLLEEDYDAWLSAPASESMAFLQQYPAKLLKAEPKPLLPKQPE